MSRHPDDEAVFPALADLIGLRGAARGLELGARRLALSVQSGGYRSVYRGRGLEFDEVRIYQPGDEVRDIDWRVTARRGRPHTRLYREERERPVLLYADLGPGMLFGSRHLKSAQAMRAGALLAWAAEQAGDRIEIYRLMGIYYWLLNKQKKALKWWDRSIKFGEESGGRLELSRTFIEVGKRLMEKKSKYNKLNDATAEEYLEKARTMLEDMNLQWDLEELGKVNSNN